jgi:hypothetical protein
MNDVFEVSCLRPTCLLLHEIYLSDEYMSRRVFIPGWYLGKIGCRIAKADSYLCFNVDNAKGS